MQKINIRNPPNKSTLSSVAQHQPQPIPYIVTPLQQQGSSMALYQPVSVVPVMMSSRLTGRHSVEDGRHESGNGASDLTNLDKSKFSAKENTYVHII